MDRQIITGAPVPATAPDPLVRVCAECHRVARPDGAWELRPASPPRDGVTYGLCYPCFVRVFGPSAR